MLNVVYDPFLTRKTPFFTLFILSRASDNTTSQNVGGTDAWPVPHFKFLGVRLPRLPLGLRLWHKCIMVKVGGKQKHVGPEAC